MTPATGAPPHAPQITQRHHTELEGEKVWESIEVPSSLCTGKRGQPGSEALAVLARDGHKVVLEKIEDWNVVELVVNGEAIFHCSIQDLEFGGDGKLDPLCEEARIAVLKAY
ncbi:PREDICTED: UPF0728 protein C10orf53 homolog [Galeopterus variegatus]|uniref:UPF0728 protein C10orf53 homolog n=1 Tax=Galeopterus variegatus TaxID=482537 RepID=A0ABM0QIN4_GALVR|nr:PREDICTED: UPF0728 protein C10orf53 homolog [Galeopterus variegatus]